MKNMRLPLIITFCIAIIGIIFGSIFDLQLSKAIASSTSGLGLTISVIGPTVGFCGVAVIGGGFFSFAYKGDYNKYLKLLFYALAVATLGLGTFYGGREYFGVNGFYNKSLKWLGFIIAFIPISLSECLGYYLFKDNENKNMWIVLLIALVVIALALVGFVNILKLLMHRPRYRIVVANDIQYLNWWQRCKNYKELMAANNLTSEEFKSYPSGHTTEAYMAIIPIVFLPLSNKKYQKYQLLAFICAFVFVMLVGFGRILAAAHYLSDVAFGAAITTLLLFIANEIVIKNKKLHPEVDETEIVEEDA